MILSMANKMIDRVLAQAFEKGKRNITTKEVEKEKERLKKVAIIVEAWRLVEEKEQK